MKLIDGKQTQTDFGQKIRDTQSQLQSWIDNVSAGFTGANPANSQCALSSTGRPVVLSGAPPATGYVPNCVYLGNAIQFTDKANGNNDSTIYAYSVFGTRLSGGLLPTDMKSSNPEPAVGTGGGQQAILGKPPMDLTQSFSLTPLFVKSVTSSAASTAYTSSHLVGFFNSINTENSASDNGQNDLNAYQYNFPGGNSAGDQGGATVVQCLEMLTTSQCGGSNYPLNHLYVCLTDGKSFAEIQIISGNGIGADVTIKYINC